MAKEDHIVYAGGRRVEKITPLKSVGVKGIKLHLTDEESMKQVVNTIINQEGRIDILINNAGYGSFGAVEDVAIAEAKKQFEVNLFGLVRLTQLVLPYMRENNYGRIINLSSMGGWVTTFLSAWYH